MKKTSSKKIAAPKKSLPERTIKRPAKMGNLSRSEIKLAVNSVLKKR